MPRPVLPAFGQFMPHHASCTLVCWFAGYYLTHVERPIIKYGAERCLPRHKVRLQLLASAVGTCNKAASYWMVCCRLEDLPAAIEIADGMLEHLNRLQASSPSTCFQTVGLAAEKLSSEPEPAGALSDEACMADIRQAVL